jgi:hypothetical protein
MSSRACDAVSQQVLIHLGEILRLIVADPIVEMHNGEDHPLGLALRIAAVELFDSVLQRPR